MERYFDKEGLSPAAKSWANLSHEQRQEIRFFVFECDMMLEWSELMSCLLLIKQY